MNRRVLVIDDNEDDADVLGELLTLEGHDVRVAYTGLSGIALARGFRPEIVLCDISLPDVDGYDVARAIRADLALRDSYLVALTGYTRAEDRQRAVEAGFDCHVAKPLSRESLDRIFATTPGTAGGNAQPR